MSRKVVRLADGSVLSENMTDIDNTKKNGGKLKFTRTLVMDEMEATSQLEWVLASLKKAKDDLDNLKNSITREGLSNYQTEVRKKIKSTKEQIDEFEDLKNQYERCNVNRRAETKNEV